MTKLLQDRKFIVRDKHKLINDPVNGTVYVHPVAILVMNTPQFQRLHHVKQVIETTIIILKSQFYLTKYKKNHF